MKDNHPSHTSKIFAWILYAALGILAIIALVFVYWLYQPNDVLNFKEEPIPVRTIRHPPPAGGVVILEANYCKTARATGRVRISFVSQSREVFLPVSEDRATPSCQDIEVPIVIPKDLTPDTYHVHIRADYTVNPIRHVIEEVDSKTFQVVKEEK